VADTRLNLTQAAKAAGVTRRTLYNHINNGKVTASRDEKNNPVIDVSELIRVYGNVNLPVKKIPTVSHRKNSRDNFTPDMLETVRAELADLRQAVTLMLDDKTAREEERRRGEEERRQLQEEVSRLGEELKREKSRGLWSRLFPGNKKPQE
jgi:vacuolar-type H+-ATPase subunit I/STV1